MQSGEKGKDKDDEVKVKGSKLMSLFTLTKKVSEPLQKGIYKQAELT